MKHTKQILILLAFIVPLSIGMSTTVVWASNNDSEIVIEESSEKYVEEPLEEICDAVSPNTDFTWEGKVITGYIGSGSEIIIPKEAIKIASNAFRGNESITSLDFEEGSMCSEIGQSAFEGCSNLSNVNLPKDTSLIIDTWAFADCNLSEITIPSKLYLMLGWVFENNKNLRKVIFESYAYGSKSTGYIINGRDFSGDEISEIIIGDKVTYIPKRLFMNSDLSDCDLILSDNIERIESDAFRDSDLRSVRIMGNGLKNIESMAFYRCKLKEIDLPSSIETIESDAFSENELADITLPTSLKKIGNGAFSGNKKLRKVNYNVPSLTEVGGLGGTIFSEDPIDELNIGSNVKIIPDNFMAYAKLENLKLEIPSGVTEIGARAFIETNLSEVNFSGNNLKKIGCFSFGYCPLSNIEIPHSVVWIESAAFSYNQQLKRIILPQNLKWIDAEAFYHDINLEKIAVYKDAELETGVLSGCSSELLTIYCYKGSPAEKYAMSGGYNFKPISEWEGGNPYSKAEEVESSELAIVPGAGESGMDSVVKLVENGVGSYTAEMVKGQKYTFGKGIWTSNDASVVSISKTSGAVNAKKAGTATLRDSKSGTVINVSVYAPVLSVTKLTLVADDKDAEVSLSGLTGSTMSTTWISANYEVASVKGSGCSATITPVGKGSTKVSAYVGGKVYTVNVTVKDLYTVGRLTDNDSIVLNAFQSVKLNFERRFAANKATWTDESDNPLTSDSIVTIKSGKVTANKVGTIKVKGSYGSDAVTLNIEVKAIPTKSIIYINKGSSVTYKNTHVKGSGMQWSGPGNISLTNATKPSVKITADNVGTGELSCNYNGVQYVTKVIVEDPTPTSTQINVPVGSMASIPLTDVKHPVVFSSNNKMVAFADESGNIYARSKGKTVLSAKINGKCVKITVNVTE